MVCVEEKQHILLHRSLCNERLPAPREKKITTSKHEWSAQEPFQVARISRGRNGMRGIFEKSKGRMYLFID